ncbi:MAG TPA: hypothetical protein VGO89_04665 [Streptomyces sp.]|jgi:hypothetical protein|nr:hypothetical protein [Streptomyces sp.]
MESAPTRITVSRNRDDDVQDRQVVLYVDGQLWTSLLFGESATRELTPGHHTLKADNTLFRKTAEFDAEAGSELRFSVASRKGPGTGLFLLLGAPFYYVTLARQS